MGLRERKREQTRQALFDAALDLFSERGYDATTIAAIAERADVAPRTFFAHHPSKEHVLFCEDDHILERLAAHLGARASDQGTIAAMREWLLALLGEYEFSDGLPREAQRRQVIRDTPALLTHELEVRARFEVVIRTAVARDLDEDAEDLRPRLVAAAALAALESVRPADGVIDTRDVALSKIDAALTFLRGGLAALQHDRVA
jgi:AcrR family transcriptional regulator